MKTPSQRAVARSTLQFGSAVMAAVLALATGPACLWLDSEVASPGVETVEVRHSADAPHAKDGSHEMASNSGDVKLGHHCQCPMHRGVAPSGSGAAVPVFLARQRVELQAPSMGFRIHFAEKFPPSRPEASLEPPVPIAFS